MDETYNNLYTHLVFNKR